MLYIELCEVELELLADRHVNIGTIGEKEIPWHYARGNMNTTYPVFFSILKFLQITKEYPLSTSLACCQDNNSRNHQQCQNHRFGVQFHR